MTTQSAEYSSAKPLASLVEWDSDPSCGPSTTGWSSHKYWEGRMRCAQTMVACGLLVVVTDYRWWATGWAWAPLVVCGVGRSGVGR